MAFTSEAAAALASTYLIREHQMEKGGYDISRMELASLDTDFNDVGEPFRIPSYLARPIVSASLWIQHHLRIMCTGESPHIRVGFSTIVAFSSFFYLIVAFSYWMQSCVVTALMFIGVTITSLFSDSINPSSRFWCSLDRSLATFGAFCGPIRALFFFTDGLVEKLEIVGLFLFSILFLAWSRNSKSQDDFVFRHTCWHVVSATSLVWLAFNAPPLWIFRTLIPPFARLIIWYGVF